MKKSFFRLSLVVVIPAVFLASYKLYALVSTQQDNKCSQCHTEVANENYSKMYIHQPLMDNNCIVCHLEEAAQKLQADEAAQDLQASSKNPNQKLDKLPKGVRLIARNSTPDTNHWFQIPYNDAGKEVLVKVLAGYSQKDIKKIEVLPLDQLDILENNGVPPRISNIKTGVQKGIFITAQISWETDKPTKSQVSYGIETQMKDAPTEDNFSSTHTVELAALKKNSLYLFTIHSADMFDNRESSDMLTFSTKSPNSGIRTAQDTFERQAGNIDLTNKVFSNGDNLVFHLTSNQPVIMTLYAFQEEKTTKPAKQDAGTSMSVSSKRTNEHAHFRSELDINNTICRSCHKEVKLSKSHPVNVFPKPGMVVPPEYPTLPDGRITCNSCHSKHASNYKYRTIKDGSKELCIGCHKDYG